MYGGTVVDEIFTGTDHRLDCLRGVGAAALPGMSLVVRDARHGLQETNRG